MKARLLLYFLLLTFSAVKVRANGDGWNINPYAYQYDMTVYIELASVDDKEASGESTYLIGAFCDDECRGIAEEKNVSGHKYLYLRVRSNKANGENITFRVKDTETGKIAYVTETVEFKSQQTIGYPSSPLLINATNQYSVTFIIDGVEQSCDMYYGDAIIMPTEINKQGFTFDKWVPEVGTVVPDHDVVYTASYIINQYTITFDTDGGSEIATITQDYNSEVTAPTAPTKTGYTFAGWDKEIPSTVPAEDVIVKALWTINQYTITFDTDGGSEVAAITQDFNSEVAAPSEPTKIGYTFAGWDKEIPATVPAEDVTVKALWTINQYTITFDTDGGSEIATITQDYNSDVTAPAEPTKIGYTFARWDKEIPSAIPAEDVTLKALWTINQYTITFDTDGGSEVEAITQNYNTEVTAPAEPTKTGYTFAGWDREIPVTIPAEDITLKALWTINQYTITFDTDGGSEVEAITQDYDSEVTAPDDPTKAGYTFAGWDKEIPATIPAEDITVKALWTINQYTITFDTDGGSEVEAITLDYNSEVTAPTAPTKTGYTFAGWDKEIPSTVPAGDVTVKALWTINQYTITFDTDGGSEIEAITLDYNSEVTAPAEPTKIGYTFAGWDKEIPATVPAEDVTVKALWTINQYTITFDTDGGSEVEAITQDYNSEVTAPTDPTKTGYTFAGWDREIPSTIPAENVTVKALWTINQYTITFDTDGGSEVEAITQDYNSEVAVPSDPIKTGYTFAGWDKEIPETIPAEDVVITALWAVNKYKLTYMVDGEIYKEYEVEYGSAIDDEENPIKEGYTFSGWNDIPEVMPDHDVIVTGTFDVSTCIDDNIVDSRSRKIYDLSGRMLKTARRGLNIINGKKVMMK